MNILIAIYPRVKQPTTDEIINEYTRKKIQYLLDNGIYDEINQTTPETLNALYDICYPKSHIQKLYEGGELKWNIYTI